MKKLILLVFLCLGACFNLQAQDIFQTWVFVIEREAGQITFNERDKIITFEQLADVKEKKLNERKVQLEILEIVKEGKDRRFIINDPKTDKIGLIYCFDIGEETMKMYLEQHAKSVEFAKSFDVPDDSGIKTYTWKKAEQILSLKNPAQITKEEAVDLLKAFKSKLEKIVDEDVPDYRNYDEQMYLKHMYYDLLVEKGYNIFGEDKSITVGVNQYLDDEKVEKFVKDIDRLIAGKDVIEKLAPIEENEKN